MQHHACSDLSRCTALPLITPGVVSPVQKSFRVNSKQLSAGAETYFGPVICARLWFKATRCSMLCAEGKFK